MGKINIQNFAGCVHLKDWLRHYDGKSYIGFIGKISILKDTDVLGFEVHKSESNWAARIESEDGSKSVNILGCQIRGITVIESGVLPDQSHSDVLNVNKI